MKRQQIHLGYSVPDGKPVSIPLNHMMVCGQTQASGKTTALEALIGRSGLQALTFVTKRGEGSFKNARRIDPYFQEDTDWRFVRALLEASQQTKMKFESPWIVRATKGTRRLSEVQIQAKHLMATSRGMNADMYMMLDAYLEILVPQIKKVEWAKNVDLRPGINVMDLTDLKPEMQQLVIKSTLDWVMAFAQETVVVIPEAWSFIPQGRGTPVKLSAERFIRQGGGLRNFLWLDSQDIAGVDKIILKSCQVWLLGVQREHNEVKRILANIPADIKQPKTKDITQLGLGEFFVCHGTTTAKTYVQPLWLSSKQAIGVAAGELDSSDVVPNSIEEYLQAPPVYQIPEEEDVTIDEKAFREYQDKSLSLLQEIAKGINILVHPDAVLKEWTEEETKAFSMALSDAQEIGKGAPLMAFKSNDDLYEEFKQRLIKDAPFIIKLYTLKPEIVVEEKRVVLETTDDLQGNLLRLVSEGFFDKGNNANQAYEALKRRGKAPATSNPVYKAMDALTELGAVLKEKSGNNVRFVKAPDVKITKR